MTLAIPAKYRSVIYAVAAISMTAVLAFGIATPEQMNVTVQNAVLLMGTAATLLARINVTPDEGE